MSKATLGELQLAIMRILWRRGEATVAEVHRELFRERGLAPTTIATMLSKMEAKGVVAHRQDGRRFVYVTTVSEERVRGTMVAELMERLFDGDVTSLVSHLLDTHDVDRREIARLKALIASRERKERS